MAKKINIYERDNRKFEVITVNILSFNGLVAETHVREIVRPNWLIFRTRYIDSTDFFTFS